MADAFLDIKPLLEDVSHLINTMYYGKASVSLKPTNEHLVTFIKYQGLNQMRNEFVESLSSTIIRYALSTSEFNSRFNILINDQGIDIRDASAKIYHEVGSLFRKSDIKGQFSELLLFNLLQYHFQALPVVRKMTITTNTGVERHGADAIHLGTTENNENCIFLGEAKTYPSGFLPAFKKGINSIIDAYQNHRDELQIYKYEKVTTEVRELIQKYLSGEIDLPVKLVVIISYCSGTAPDLAAKEEYIKHYIDDAISKCNSVKDSHYQDKDKNPMNAGLVKELNFILFPVNELEKLLEEFRLKLGIK